MQQENEIMQPWLQRKIRDETGSRLTLLLIVIWSFARASADVECQITAFLDFQIMFTTYNNDWQIQPFLLTLFGAFAFMKSAAQWFSKRFSCYWNKHGISNTLQQKQENGGQRWSWGGGDKISKTRANKSHKLLSMSEWKYDVSSKGQAALDWAKCNENLEKKNSPR